MTKEYNKKIFIFGCITIFMSLIITISYYHLWGTDIHVPLTGYRGDSVGMLLSGNNYIRGGNVHNKVCYMAPYMNVFTAEFGDSEMLVPLIGILCKILGNVEAAINVIAVLNSVLIALAMYVVCVKLKINEKLAVVLGVTYSCLPYFVFACNTELLAYGACFYVPIFCYFIINLMQEERNGGKINKFKITLFVFTMLYTGLNIAYYAFFAMLILAFAGIYALCCLKSTRNVMLVIIAYLAVAAGIAEYTFPNVFYKNDGGVFNKIWDNNVYHLMWAGIVAIMVLIGIIFYKRLYSYINIKRIWIVMAIFGILAVVGYIILKKYTNYIGEYEGRTVHGVENGALEIVNMVLPTPHNILEPINKMLNELRHKDFTMLGILTGIGFLYSVLNVFQPVKSDDIKNEILRICGICNCFIVFVGIKGGIMLLIAAYITTGIRNYARISIFVACFSLISLGILLDKVIGKIRLVKQDNYRKLLYAYIGIGGFICFALSCPTHFIYNYKDRSDLTYGKVTGYAEYKQRKREYDNWQQIIDEIEMRVPNNSMIFELPVEIEEEYYSELLTRGMAYELAIPAIISKKTAWSYAGGWQPEADMIENTEGFINEVREIGFAGIYVDILLYNDNSYEEQLQALEKYLGQPIVCNENRRYFFTVDNINAEE